MTPVLPVVPIWVVLIWVGLLGLAIGSFLNVVAYRVPAGIPLARESRCPRCDAPVRWWQNIPVASWVGLRGRCRECSGRIAARYPLIEALTAAAFIGVALLVATGSLTGPLTGGGSWGATVAVAAAYLSFAAASIVLAVIDLDTFRLPKAIVLPALAVGIGLLTLACLLGADWARLLRALAAAAAVSLAYQLVRLLRPDAMGGGDVKLAALIGLHLGWIGPGGIGFGWGVVVVGVFAAFVLGGVYGAVLMLLRRASRRTAIPFGPWMLLGAWTGIVFGQPLSDWYLRLVIPA
ncbi:prepilin peptidase [Microbacterium sp. YJN-G]|uniref:prepilin peptidase n=1 Tax=Microbacterium sp. YJN-G TaxID=2763257 RepID=UPI001878690E|nr:A24 family peptidase [Microbacterium sp. YJN-G]